jgi:hypothetical protein
MPGQIPLTTKYYPSDFNVTTILIPQHATATSPPNRAFPVAYFDRDAVIDSIYIWTEGFSTSTDMTFYKLVAPTQASGTTPVSGQQAITTTKASGTGLAQFITGVTTGFSINTAHNIVPAGSMLWFGYGSGTWASIATQMQIQVRWRSQL